jgi:hypothetical protein
MNNITEDKPEVNDKEKEINWCEVRVHFTYYKYPSVSEKSVMVEDKWVKRDSTGMYRFSMREFQLGA